MNTDAEPTANDMDDALEMADSIERFLRHRYGAINEATFASAAGLIFYKASKLLPPGVQMGGLSQSFGLCLSAAMMVRGLGKRLEEATQD